MDSYDRGDGGFVAEANKLTELGGTSETHAVSDEAVEEAQTAATATEC